MKTLNALLSRKFTVKIPAIFRNGHRFFPIAGFFFLSLFLFLSESGYPQKVITVDFDAVKGPVKDLQGGNLLFEHTEKLLHKEGINMIRTHDMHHLLDYQDYSSFWNYEGNGKYTINPDFDPLSPSGYDWHKADSVLDFIVNRQFKLFYRIGVSYPNPRIPPLSPYDPPVNDTAEPLNFSRFASLTKHIVMHFNQGWDNGKYYGIRYWELWNEPGGLFWHGSAAQFRAMYKAVADTLKKAFPDIYLGSPGAVPSTSIGVNPQYRENFIAYCAKNNLPLDFYSWHLYGCKNPYGIKAIADTIRTLLDTNGYKKAENIISEINSNLDNTLDTLAVSPYGAAYYLSTLLTAQEAPVDKLFWYPSCVGVQNKRTGDTMVSRTYYALTFFHQLQQSTPVEVQNNGNEVVEGNWDTLERNFMVLTSKSEDGQKLSVLISNLYSDISAVEIYLENLPWSPVDSILVTQQIISKDFMHKTVTRYVKGSSELTLVENRCPDPGVLFYQLEKTSVTAIPRNVAGLFTVSLPVYRKVFYKNLPGQTRWMEVYSLSGKLLLRKNRINALDLPHGTYLLVLRDRHNKMILSRKIVKVPPAR